MTKSPEQSVLDFVVVGAQRSATTHLNSCLRGHPEIFMCPDEVPYFESPFFSTSPLVELERALAPATPTQLRGISRPDYLARPECAGNIKSVAPSARIVAVLRDPVDRAISAYHWYMQFGLLPLEPLNDGMERLLAGWTDPAYPRAGDILEYGFYGRHLSRYIAAFGSDQVLALVDEEARDLNSLRTIYRFLGVGDGHRPEARRRKTNAGTYDLRRLRVLRLRRRFAWSWDDVSTYRYQPRRLRRPVASVFSAGVVALDRYVLAKVLSGPPPTLAPELEQRWRDAYAADVKLLEELLERDLTRWRTGVEPA